MGTFPFCPFGGNGECPINYSSALTPLAPQTPSPASRRDRAHPAFTRVAA
jgi:hypothetical protein